MYSQYVNRLIIKDKSRQINHLKDENRGRKKKINRLIRATQNNHAGMLYWKNKYEQLIADKPDDM